MEIKKTIGKISLVSFVIILAMSFSSLAYAEATPSPISKDGNALVNGASFAELFDDVESSEGNDPPELESDLVLQNELEEITEKENFSVKEIDSAMAVLEKRSEVATFLVGNNLKVLRFQLVQIKEQARLLNVLSSKTDDSETKDKIDSQIKFLREEQQKVEEFILDQKDAFSLFGWFTNII